MRSKLEVAGYALAILSVVGVGASALGNARQMSVKQDRELDGVIDLIVAESLAKRDEDRRERALSLPANAPGSPSTAGSAPASLRDSARDAAERVGAPESEVRGAATTSGRVPSSSEKLASLNGIAAGNPPTPTSQVPSAIATERPVPPPSTGSAPPQSTGRRALAMQTDVTAGAAAVSEERKAKATVLARKSPRRARNQKSRTHFLPLELTMLPKFTAYRLLGLR